jgi:hypothetical protein
MERADKASGPSRVGIAKHGYFTSSGPVNSFSEAMLGHLTEPRFYPYLLNERCLVVSRRIIVSSVYFLVPRNLTNQETAEKGAMEMWPL